VPTTIRYIIFKIFGNNSCCADNQVGQKTGPLLEERNSCIWWRRKMTYIKHISALHLE